MTKQKLTDTIDQLGKLRDQLHVLKCSEKALAETLRGELKAIRGKAAEGRKYRAELIAAEHVLLEDLAALRRVAGRKFLRCVKADIGASRRELGEEVVDRLGRTERSWKLCVYSREPAKAPRYAPERSGKRRST